MRQWVNKAKQLILGEDSSCMVCGQDSVDMTFGMCDRCFSAFPFAEEPLIQKSFSVCLYEPPVKQLIYDYKYNDQRYLGKHMADLMAAVIQSKNLQFDSVLMVPSSGKRKNTRGFDHMLYIARILSDNLGIECGENVLMRTQETRRLKGLSKAERLQELENVFQLSPEVSVSGKRLLLIDDILTTGATLSACTEALLPDHPEEIYWLTFAMVV